MFQLSESWTHFEDLFLTTWRGRHNGDPRGASSSMSMTTILPESGKGSLGVDRDHTGQCFRCGGLKHFFAECPQRSAQERTPRGKGGKKGNIEEEGKYAEKARYVEKGKYGGKNSGKYGGKNNHKVHVTEDMLTPIMSQRLRTCGVVDETSRSGTSFKVVRATVGAASGHKGTTIMASVGAAAPHSEAKFGEKSRPLRDRLGQQLAACFKKGELMAGMFYVSNNVSEGDQDIKECFFLEPEVEFILDTGAAKYVWPRELIEQITENPCVEQKLAKPLLGAGGHMLNQFGTRILRVLVNTLHGRRWACMPGTIANTRQCILSVGWLLDREFALHLENQKKYRQ